MPSDRITVDEDSLDARVRAAFAKPADTQGALVPVPATSVAISDAVITAQKVQVERDDAKVLHKIKVMATVAGEDWYYRYPVKNKGQTDWIEGPSIKCANNVARIYGNCQVDTRIVDNGDSWIIYARFVDYESGFSYTRPFQQRKGQRAINTQEGGRALDIALQIGVSKAIRNVITNSLETYTNFAFEEAKSSIVEKVGKRLDQYRERVLQRLGELHIEVGRVESATGRAHGDWLAADVARIIAQLQAINDGMATIDETWPSGGEAPARPTREQFKEPVEPWEVVDIAGETSQFPSHDEAVKALRHAFDLAEKQGGDALKTVFDNNGALLDDLARRGQPDLARELSLEYGTRRQRVPTASQDDPAEDRSPAADPATQEAEASATRKDEAILAESSDGPADTDQQTPPQTEAAGDAVPRGTEKKSETRSKPAAARPGAGSTQARPSLPPRGAFPAREAPDGGARGSGEADKVEPQKGGPPRSAIWNDASYVLPMTTLPDHRLDFGKFQRDLEFLAEEAESIAEIDKLESDNAANLARLRDAERHEMVRQIEAMFAACRQRLQENG